MTRQNKKLFTGAMAGALAAAAVLTGCTGSVQSRMQKVAEYRQHGKLQPAKIELKNILTDHPNNAQARRALGEIYLTRGRYADAVAQLQAARKVGATGQKTDLSLARALIETHEYEKALTILKDQKAPASKAGAKVWTLRGRAYAGLGKKPEAKHALKQALSAHKGYAPALIEQAMLAQGEGDYKRAKKILIGVVTSDPKNVQAWLAGGTLEYQHHHFKLAAVALQKALKLSAHSFDLPPKTKFLARARLTDCQFKLGREKKARDNAKFLMSRRPNNAYANYLQALEDYRQKNYTQATDHLQTSLHAKPQSLPAITLLGLVKAAQGNYASAENYLSKVIARAPDNLHSREVLAKVYMQQNRPGDAVKTLRVALDKHGSDSHLLALLAKASLQAGDHKAGVRYLKQSAQHAQGNVKVQVDLAQALVQAGDSDAALRLLKATKLKGKSDRIKAGRVKITALLRKHETRQAISAAKALTQEQAHDPQVFNLLGSTYLATGKAAEAGKAFNRALEISPKNRRAELNLGLLALREKKPDTAEKYLQTVLDQHPRDLTALAGMAESATLRGEQKKTLKWLRKAHKSHPDAVGIQVALVRHYLKHNHANEALPIAEALIKKSPDNPGYYHLSGFVKLGADQPKQAIQDFQKAVHMAPKQPGFRMDLALAELANDQRDAGMENLRTLRQNHPDFLPAARELAVVQLKQGNPKAALATAHSLREGGHAVAAEALKGDILRAQGKDRQAVRAYRAAYREQPARQFALRVYQLRKRAGLANPESLLADWQKKHPKDLEAAAVLGGYYQSQDKLGASARLYRSILEADADNLLALNNLALIYQKQNDPRAMEMAEKAHKAAPGNANAADTLGWMLVNKGKNARGLALLRKAAKAEPKTAEIHYHLAVALARSGHKRRAQKILKKLLSSKQAFPGRDQARKLSRQLG